MGGLKVGQQAMEKRLDRLEQMIADGFKEIRAEIADLKIRDRQRSALEKAAVWMAGAVGAVFAAVGTALVEHFAK